MYAGWELVGLSSALLIAFFHERPEPVRNGLRAFVVYRGCDAGLLAAAVLVHHWTARAISRWCSARARGRGAASLSGAQVTLVAAAVLIAAMGKSAQVPLSGWLPRAMEGPTPSSAIFYGALSVHAGAYLLLRIGPLLDRAPVVAALVVVVGLATALHATLVARVQTDIKCASRTPRSPKWGSSSSRSGSACACWRSRTSRDTPACAALQFLRTPSLLHDFHQVENAVVVISSVPASTWSARYPARCSVAGTSGHSNAAVSTRGSMPSWCARSCGPPVPLIA